MADEQSYADSSGYFSPQTAQSRRKLYEAMLAQGLQGGPIGHWTQGVGRLAKAIIGGYGAYKADEDERNSWREIGSVLSGAFPQPLTVGKPGTDTPAAPTTPASRPAGVDVPPVSLPSPFSGSENSANPLGTDTYRPAASLTAPATGSSEPGTYPGVRPGTPFTDRWRAFLDGVRARGLTVDPTQSGGYNPRNIRGTNRPSLHASDQAYDLNSSANPEGSVQDEADIARQHLERDMGGSTAPITQIHPMIARELAQENGLRWGGDFRGRSPDPMHFEIAGGVPMAQRSITARAGLSPQVQGWLGGPETETPVNPSNDPLIPAQEPLNNPQSFAAGKPGEMGPPAPATPFVDDRQNLIGLLPGVASGAARLAGRMAAPSVANDDETALLRSPYRRPATQAELMDPTLNAAPQLRAAPAASPPQAAPAPGAPPPATSITEPLGTPSAVPGVTTGSAASPAPPGAPPGAPPVPAQPPAPPAAPQAPAMSQGMPANEVIRRLLTSRNPQAIQYGLQLYSALAKPTADYDFQASEGSLYRVNKRTGEAQIVAGNGQGKPPPGYRATPNGGLEPIPGGPAEHLPGDMSGRLAMMQTARTNFGQARQYLVNQMGIGSAIGNALPFGATISPQYDTARRQVQVAVESALRVMTGAAAPESEVRQYMDMFMPRATDPPQVRTQKLNLLEGFMTNAEEIATRGHRPAGQQSSAGGQGRVRTYNPQTGELE